MPTLAAVALQLELAVDGLYHLDFEHTRRDGPRRRSMPRVRPATGR